MRKWLPRLVVIVLCVALSLPGSTQAAPQVKELNFVFLHGAGGHSCTFQLLADAIEAQAPSYIRHYEESYPGTRIRINTLARCYPNNVDISTWASNIADSLEQHFQKRNLILIGHSMGGKTALYSVAQNIGDLASKVSLVVTINSPIKNLSRYYLTGGVDYWRARGLISSDNGVLGSLAYYDSTEDGKWVGSNRHWLAFVSSETAPSSEQFDISGVDPLPRDMDDGLVPISAQYSTGADVIYYGPYGHSDFATIEEIAASMAEKILRYIFGRSMEYSVFSRGAMLEHRAGWLPVTDTWQDVVGEMPAGGGTIVHRNDSYSAWQEWEDVVGENYPGRIRTSYRVSRVNSLPFLTSIKEARWLVPDKPEDYRLYIRTRAAPRSTVRVEWSIFENRLLALEAERDHYEVEIVTGTPFTEVDEVSWPSSDSRDLMLEIRSKAEGPFRWFKAEWRAYAKERRLRRLIDEIPGEALP